MKTITLPLFLLLLTQLHSQRFREVVIWEINTINDGQIIGASLNENDADLTIGSFSIRNRGQKYEARSFAKRFTTMKVEKMTDNPLIDLKIYSAKGYLVLSPEKLNMLKRYKGKSLSGIAIAAYAQLDQSTYSKARQEIQLIQKYQIPKEIVSRPLKIVSN